MTPAKVVGDAHLTDVLNAMPMPVFIMDTDLMILYANSEAERLLEGGEGPVIRKLCGEILHCLNNMESEAGCGFTKHCPDCIIRQAVHEAHEGQKAFRQKYTMGLQRNGVAQEVQLLVTSAPFDIDGKAFSLLILEDNTELDELRKLIPICASCKKIRRDGKYWEDVEKYITRSMDVDLTHSICPACMKTLYPEFTRDNQIPTR